MPSHPNYAKKQIPIDTVSWTPIVAPIDCMGVGIKNSVAVSLSIRTDASDPATQDVIPASNQDAIVVPRSGDNPASSRSGQRFLAGETIAYLQAASGTGPALCTFVA